MATKVYDSTEVTVSFSGVPIKGYADGEFLTITFESNVFDDMVGTDGEVTRSKTNDFRATATIKLLSTSDSNDLLSAIYNVDRKAANGAGIGVFLVKDRQGRSVYMASESWIQKPPDVSFDKTATAREWVIRLANLEYFTGGN